MKKTLLYIGTATILTLFSSISFAKNNCGNANIESEKADSLLEKLYDSWGDIYQYYDKYSKYGCYSEGYYGESIADSVVKRLANHWDSLNDLALLTRKNKQFENFLISKINATVSDSDLLKIHELANKECPNELLNLCKKIDKKTLKAYKEMGEIN